MATKRRQFGRVRRLPSGRYQARYLDAQGQDRPVPQTFPTKADASAFLARVQAEMQKGEWRDPALGQVTFRSWAEQWLAANPAKRATTLARDKVVLQTHFSPALGERQLSSITRAHVKGCVDGMLAKLAPTTVRTNLGVLNAVLNAAVDADLVARSPARGIRVGDVDFLRRTLTVRQTIAEVEGRLMVADTKSRSSRRTLSVPTFFVEELAEHLARHRAGASPDDLVFTSPEGGPLRRYCAERVFIPAVKLAGLDQALTFHGIRHVAASLMVEQGEHPRWSKAGSGTPPPGSRWSCTHTSQKPPTGT